MPCPHRPFLVRIISMYTLITITRSLNRLSTRCEPCRADRFLQRPKTTDLSTTTTMVTNGNIPIQYNSPTLDNCPLYQL